MNKVIHLDKCPHRETSLNNFKIINERVHDIRETEILFKALYISTNTYLRGRRNKAKPYTPPFKLNKRMIAEYDSRGNKK
jgi:NADPH-dependent curcumin reductase CurA